MYYWEGLTHGQPNIVDIVGLFDDEKKLRRDFFRMARWREDQTDEEEELFRHFTTEEVMDDEWRNWLTEYLDLDTPAGYFFEKMKANEVTLN
jgi:hypothetical protein